MPMRRYSRQGGPVTGLPTVVRAIFRYLGVRSAAGHVATLPPGTGVGAGRAGHAIELTCPVTPDRVYEGRGQPRRMAPGRAWSAGVRLAGWS